MTAKTTTNSKRSTCRGASTGSTSSESSRVSSEPRRANKPLMEKRRRARINQSLAVLKTLILDSAKSENTKHSKLEKADILELTVRHFQRHRNLDTPGLNKYRAGYADCVREVQRYLETPDAQTMCVIDPGIRQRLLRHLENCVAEIDTDISPSIASGAPDALFKDVIGLDKRMPIAAPSSMEYGGSGAKHDPAAVLAHMPEAALPTELMYSARLDAAAIIDMEQDKKVRLEADSSTAEEINNNADPAAYRSARENEMVARMEAEIVAQHVTLPNNVIKMYDGNFVFVLPSHYIQLAAALGINLNNQVHAMPVPEAGAPPDSRSLDEHRATPATKERPLDFSSKNNDAAAAAAAAVAADSMWRPW